MAGQPLTWYALLPNHEHFAVGARVVVDPATRRLSLPYRSGPYELDFEGFALPTPQGVTRATRNQDRAAAYLEYREGARRLGLGEAAASARHFAAGRELAARAGDVLLSEWLDRSFVRALLRGGEVERGLVRAEALWAAAFDRSEVAFEIARSLHGGGDVSRSTAWYARALGEDGDAQRGRTKPEVVHNAVAALAEVGRHGEARDLLARFAGSLGVSEMEPDLAFVDWMAGSPPNPATVRWTSTELDFSQYWRLELELLAGESVTSLLERVRAARMEASETRSLLDGLEAELLRRGGRISEAGGLARGALERARREAVDEPRLRPHLPLLEKRAALLAGLAPRSFRESGEVRP
jgi:hypothetical protein